MTRIRSTLQRLAQGDLSIKCNHQSNDEFGELASNIDQTIESLRNLIVGVKKNTQEISAVSEQNQGSTQELIKASSNQGEETSQVALAIAEMEKAFSGVTASAVLTSKKVRDAESLTINGSDVINRNVIVSESLSEILSQCSHKTHHVAELSQNITSILTVIQSIADQTNLLALNAAIESARAGEHGRGFAVVAEEVRSLANKTSGSATEISDMLDQLRQSTAMTVQYMTDCMAEMENSHEKNKQAQASMSSINHIIQEIVEMSEKIVATTEQQQSTSTEISKNINRISSSAKEANASTVNLSKVSETLNSMSIEQAKKIAQFNL